jgi:ABC-type dipeptide/oligopeptide/nickel transport system permease subunit
VIPDVAVPVVEHRPRRFSIAPSAGIALGFVVLVVVAGIFAPLVAPMDPNKQVLHDALLPPGSVGRSGRHLLGTDELGRDIASRLVYGIRPLIVVILLSVSIAAFFGLLFGLLAGTAPRPGEATMMRVADIQLSIPPIILAVLLAVVLAPGVKSTVIAIALVTWPQYARVVRAEVLRVKTSDYVALARVAGLGPLRSLRDHIVPNVMNTFVVLCSLNLSVAIIFASALSFLGLGVQPPTPDWGNMLAEGTQYLNSWWMVVMPGIAISLLALAFNRLGDDLRDRLDPRFGTP